jgi:hypothetical protein
MGFPGRCFPSCLSIYATVYFHFQGWIKKQNDEFFSIIKQASCSITHSLGTCLTLYRLLTGSILAHELMHAWLRLQGNPTSQIHFKLLCMYTCLLAFTAKTVNRLSAHLQCNFFEGAISTTLIYLIWFSAGTYPHMRPEVEEGICQVMSHIWLTGELKKLNGNRSSSSSSSSSNKSNSIQARLGEFYLHQISTDSSPIYGDGYRHGFHAYKEFGLQRVLEHLRLTANFPWKHFRSRFRKLPVFWYCQSQGLVMDLFYICIIFLKGCILQQLRSGLLGLGEAEWFSWNIFVAPVARQCGHQLSSVIWYHYEIEHFNQWTVLTSKNLWSGILWWRLFEI